MSAIKKYMSTIAESKNRTSLLLEAWKEISDRLDALEQQAHSHAVSQSMTISDERSCENIEVPPVSVVTGEYWPFLGGEQPRADQVGTPISCAEAIKKSREVLHKAEDERKRFAEEEAERNKCSECDDLRARLAEAERIARENGELAIARKVEIERLEKEQSDILFLIRTRLQPPGSPCPGGPVMLATWITGEAVKNIERLEKENAELKRAYISLEEMTPFLKTYGVAMNQDRKVKELVSRAEEALKRKLEGGKR